MVWLSHVLDSATPAYGGGEGPRLEPMTEIRRGDTANTTRIVTSTHLGTHVDVPRHFFQSGEAIDEIPAEFWFFKSPALIDVAVTPGELINPRHLRGGLSEANDLLLVRTGHEQCRGRKEYWNSGPGLSAELALHLRERYPTLRAVGIDAISITSRLRRNEGRHAHRAFLDPDAQGRPLVLIEDMALSRYVDHIAHVVALPLLVRGGDGGPCAAVGITHGELRDLAEAGFGAE